MPPPPQKKKNPSLAFRWFAWVNLYRYFMRMRSQTCFVSFAEYGRYPQGDNRLLPQLFSAVVSQLQRVVDAFRQEQEEP